MLQGPIFYGVLEVYKYFRGKSGVKGSNKKKEDKNSSVRKNLGKYFDEEVNEKKDEKKSFDMTSALLSSDNRFDKEVYAKPSDEEEVKGTPSSVKQSKHFDEEEVKGTPSSVKESFGKTSGEGVGVKRSHKFIDLSLCSDSDSDEE